MHLSAAAGLAFWLLACSAAFGQHLQHFGQHSPDDVRARCAKVHGVFYDHGGAYGCSFSRGTVQCSPGQHCVGYSRHLQPTPLPQPEVQPYWRDDQWRRW